METVNCSLCIKSTSYIQLNFLDHNFALRAWPLIPFYNIKENINQTKLERGLFWLCYKIVCEGANTADKSV